jgi:hypothetical protein
MPFTKPYRNYQPGDLFYGLAIPRQNLIQELTGNQAGTAYKNMEWIDLFLHPVNQYTAHENIMKNFRFAMTLKYHPKYWRALGYQLEGIDDDSAKRAKSKGGLLWATTVERKHVHFTLERLNMDHVVRKTYPGWGVGGVGADRPAVPNVSEKQRSITGAELRWIYRWRNNAQVSSRIQFWNKIAGVFEQCEPPWAANQNLWQEYLPRSANGEPQAAGIEH